MPSLEKPRVALVYRLDRRGGVQSVSYALIRGLNRLGIVPDVLWDVEPDWEALALQDARANFRPLRFPIASHAIDRLNPTLTYLAWVPNVLRTSQIRPGYDFYYIFFNGLLVDDGAAHVRYLSGPPLLPQLQENSRWPFRVARALYRGLLRRWWPAFEYHRDSNYVINSNFTAELFAEAHGVRLPVVHPPIDVSNRSYDREDLAGRDTITFFSRFVGSKRPELAIELAARHPNLRAVLMGGVAPHRREYFERLQRQAAELGRADIHFIANPSNEQVNAELARTRFYVFPAVREHFGMTTVEAIASGAVPFVHDSGGQREIVAVDSLRFRDEDMLSRFDALVNTPPEQLNRYRDRLSTHIRQFSEEVFVEKMVAFLPLPEFVGEGIHHGRKIDAVF